MSYGANPNPSADFLEDEEFSFSSVPVNENQVEISQEAVERNIAMIQALDDNELLETLFQLKENNESSLGHADVVKALLKRVKLFWMGKTNDFAEHMKWCHKRFGYENSIPANQVTSNLLESLWKKKLDLMQLIVAVQREMCVHKIKMGSTETSEDAKMLSQCFNGCNACYDTLSSYYHTILNDQGKIDHFSPRFEVWNHAIPCYDPAKIKPKPQLIMYLLNIAHQKGYKRYKGDVYRPVYSKRWVERKNLLDWLLSIDEYGTPLAVEQLQEMKKKAMEKWDQEGLSWTQGLERLAQTPNDNVSMDVVFEIGGNNTYSYERVCTIQEFIHENVQAEDNFLQWQNLIDKNNAKQVVEHLETCDNPKFKDITNLRSRFAFAYAQGMYFSDEDTFYTYTDPALAKKNRIACRYFNALFPCKPTLRDKWKDLKTPLFDSIFTYQKLPREVINIIYALGGRMIYPVGMNDNWQVAPMLKGIAGSGKSTVAKTFFNFFEPADVGSLNSTGEITFALMSIHDKYVVFATEIKKNFNFPQDLLQQCVSNDPVNVAIKHGKAKMMRWTAPLMFAGNETPNWQDSQGSMRRRILCFLFEIFVKENDKKPQFEEAILRDELPILIRKCNQAYLELVEKHYNEDIWNFLPKYFKETADNLQSQINPVISFLRSSKIRFHEKFFVSVNDFTGALREYCTQTGFGKFTYTSDSYKSIFDNMGLVVVNERRQYKNRTILQEYILGIRIRETDVEDDGAGSGDENENLY